MALRAENMKMWTNQPVEVIHVWVQDWDYIFPHITHISTSLLSLLMWHCDQYCEGVPFLKWTGSIFLLFQVRQGCGLRHTPDKLVTKNNSIAISDFHVELVWTCQLYRWCHWTASHRQLNMKPVSTPFSHSFVAPSALETFISALARISAHKRLIFHIYKPARPLKILIAAILNRLATL